MGWKRGGERVFIREGDLAFGAWSGPHSPLETPEAGAKPRRGCERSGSEYHWGGGFQGIQKKRDPFFVLPKKGVTFFPCPSAGLNGTRSGRTLSPIPLGKGGGTDLKRSLHQIFKHHLQREDA